MGLLGALFQLLDCVDGNVARVRGTEGLRGDYLSMVVGQWYWVMLLAAFGQLAAGEGAGWLRLHGLACGVGLGMLVVLGRLGREYVSIRHGAAAGSGSGDLGVLAWLRVFGSGLDNLIFLMVPVAGWLHGLGGAFAATGVYVSGVFVVSQYECWRALRA